MVKIVSKPGINMIVHLLNQIMIVGVISAGWERSTIDNCFMKKKIFQREREKTIGEILKSAFQILKIAKKVTELTR